MNYRHDSDIVESYGFKVIKKDIKVPRNDYTLVKSPNGFNVNW